ncbi:Rieske 2Fe-2S domain-containing protein [Streptomyces sp. NPDC020379]|uniref:Rieske 2Fe-2S domain-containing protein n=1 Tax=Streptomyces sp. NPDC020379 TaxID=3365071 RepID=UPI003795D192
MVVLGSVTRKTRFRTAVGWLGSPCRHSDSSGKESSVKSNPCRSEYSAVSGQAVIGNSSPPLPYPTGWFCVRFSKSWKPGSVVAAPLMGEDLVVHRTRSGKGHATRSCCPHLGAGGAVDD